ncbi:MAG: hypothetical protein WC742_15435 [Gallionellaceae bacterium]
MRNLTAVEIAKLASQTDVKKIAVENFLSTLYAPAGKSGNLANLYSDAASYKWNAATVGAIRSGIELAYK